MKFQERVKAIRLRKLGASYSRIRREIPVSKSTLSLWFRDVKLTYKAYKRIQGGLELSRVAAARAKKKLRIATTEAVFKGAKSEFRNLLNTPLFLIGLSLYLAEGDKSIQERVKFTNSDPKLISVMMRWFREICAVSEGKFRVALHIHDLQSNKKVKGFWSHLTKISTRQFQATYIKKSSLRSRRNVLYNGTCSIIIHSRPLFRRIMGWRAAFLDYFLATA